MDNCESLQVVFGHDDRNESFNVGVMQVVSLNTLENNINNFGKSYKIEEILFTHDRWYRFFLDIDEGADESTHQKICDKLWKLFPSVIVSIIFDKVAQNKCWVYTNIALYVEQMKIVSKIILGNVDDVYSTNHRMRLINTVKFDKKRMCFRMYNFKDAFNPQPFNFYVI